MITDNLSKRTILAICILLLPLIISPGCLEDDDVKREYEYNIYISGYEGTDNYTLYIPFPADSEGYSKEIFGSLEKSKKEIEFGIINSSKGICLELTHDDNVTIELKGDLNRYSPEPSMYNHSYSNSQFREYYWVYSNSNETLHLKMYYEKYSSKGSGSRKTYEAEGNIKRGWQLVDAETENEEVL